MPYAMQTEWMQMLETLRYVLFFVSALAFAGLGFYLVGIFVLCRNEAPPRHRQSVASRIPTVRLATARAALP